MRFTFEDKDYVLEFSYDKKRVQKHTGGIVESRYPYTTASILIVDETNRNMDEWEVFQKADAGVLRGDKFDKETGRMVALRNLMPLVPEGMKPLVWDAYHSRPDKKIKTVAQAKKIIKGLRKLLLENMTKNALDQKGDD